MERDIEVKIKEATLRKALACSQRDSRDVGHIIDVAMDRYYKNRKVSMSYLVETTDFIFHPQVKKDV